MAEITEPVQVPGGELEEAAETTSRRSLKLTQKEDCPDQYGLLGAIGGA